ncbi:MAG: NAD(P)-dependent oxidoreductase [Steroidobacteraceae bacterium]
MATIAFIGLGNMGLGMARRLLQAGHDLRIYNRTGSKAAELERGGARRCLTPREACTDVDAVFSMTADDTSSRSVWLGPDGALAARLAPRALAIECSTLSRNWVMELAAQARARALRYLDAPVTGLPGAAAAGTLTLLVGADPVHLESARPLLNVIADRILHFGAIGAGTAYKLIINLIGAVQIASLAEGLALAERAGLNLATVADAITTGQAASPQVVRNAHRIVADDHDREVVFTPVLRLKDTSYALDLARELGMCAPFGQVAAGQLQRLIDLGYAQVNESKIIEVARQERP